MANRARDWFAQAQGRHEWACFAAHQAAEAEKAVKALHLHLGQEAWGHVVAKLLRELPSSVAVPEELVQKAHVLDNAYIPSCYPNAHPEGAPFEHYGSLQSEEAIKYASEILEFVRAQMA
ncbi:MAG: HEPN domain-containing protein [Candidatus Bipolaricaulia bacterium]